MPRYLITLIVAVEQPTFEEADAKVNDLVAVVPTEFEYVDYSVVEPIVEPVEGS